MYKMTLLPLSSYERRQSCSSIHQQSLISMMSYEHHLSDDARRHNDHVRNYDHLQYRSLTDILDEAIQISDHVMEATTGTSDEAHMVSFCHSPLSVDAAISYNDNDLETTSNKPSN
jgi:hypothetical protein